MEETYSEYIRKPFTNYVSTYLEFLRCCILGLLLARCGGSFGHFAEILLELVHKTSPTVVVLVNEAFGLVLVLHLVRHDLNFGGVKLVLGLLIN